MNYLYTTTQLRHIEKEMLASLPLGALMHQAAQKTADFIAHKYPPQSNILVLVGPGNNGGDGLEMATLLKDYRITILQLTPSTTKEAQNAYQKARTMPHIQWVKRLESVLEKHFDLIVDALLGIGQSRRLSQDFLDLVTFANHTTFPILSIDVPTGLNADTGTVWGTAIKANDTITFLGNKPGFYTQSGRDHSGNVHVELLGRKDQIISNCRLNDPIYFPISKRLHNTHKGIFGRVAILGGANGMVGAALLAARAAIQSGAGLTYIAYIEAPLPVDILQPEVMHRPAASFDDTSKILVIGPGLGTSSTALNQLQTRINHPLPIVLDADALNLIATHDELQQKLKNRTAPTIITPHPLEAARLLNNTVDEVQSDRLQTALTLSKRFNTITILKGSGTIIATPDETCLINPTGGPALATAGTGDVLAGICGALLAQMNEALPAALAAVWLHGKAADLWTLEHKGAIGLTAHEIIPKVRFLLNKLTEETAAFAL